ncbi:MAG: hypothetical protein M1823_004847 [Watsoniomyces obsoletus]|nr:MAG: hypothetical protein M1823_004847 [Watsoniomyces obsoletus]
MANDKNSLARIRENQRRSRQRRREYLQELEGRWRRCEQAGAAASSELQQAARKVALENRALRALLRERGMTDAEVDDYVRKTQDAPQVSSLEGLLATRKDCGNGCPSELSQSPSVPVPDTPSEPSSRPLGQAPAPAACPDCPPTTQSPTEAEVLPANIIPQPVPNQVFGALSISEYPPSLAPSTSMVSAEMEMPSMFAAPLPPPMSYALEQPTSAALAGSCCGPGIHCEPVDGTTFKLFDTYTGQSLSL